MIGLANVKFLEEYKSACLLAVTETWLKDHDSQADLEIDGFGEPFRLDRDPTATGKSLGGGLALYVKQNWCGNVIVRECLCALDIELFSVRLGPFIYQGNSPSYLSHWCTFTPKLMRTMLFGLSLAQCNSYKLYRQTLLAL